MGVVASDCFGRLSGKKERTKMKFDFSADEMQAVLFSLIARRNLLKNIIDGRESPIYGRELQIVESVMEKMFPGSVKAIDSTREVA